MHPRCWTSGLVIAVVLLCPYVCKLPQLIATRTMPSCCSHCSLPAEHQQTPAAPADPERSPGSSSCLCHGAVMGEACAAPVPTDLLLSWDLVFVVAQTASAPAVSRWNELSSAPPLLGGGLA